jgi:hypothetical protein
MSAHETTSLNNIMKKLPQNLELGMHSAQNAYSLHLEDSQLVQCQKYRFLECGTLQPNVSLSTFRKTVLHYFHAACCLLGLGFDPEIEAAPSSVDISKILQEVASRRQRAYFSQ